MKRARFDTSAASSFSLRRRVTFNFWQARRASSNSRSWSRMARSASVRRAIACRVRSVSSSSRAIISRTCSKRRLRSKSSSAPRSAHATMLCRTISDITVSMTRSSSSRWAPGRDVGTFPSEGTRRGGGLPEASRVTCSNIKPHTSTRTSTSARDVGCAEGNSSTTFDCSGLLPRAPYVSTPRGLRAAR